MGEMGMAPNATLETERAPDGATRIGLDPAFRFVPLLGLLGFFAVRFRYLPLDDVPLYWFAVGLCFAALILLSAAQDRAKAGKAVGSFFPITTWLAFGPAALAGVLLLNGALDRTSALDHRQTVVNKEAVRGRWGSMSYRITITSWRANRDTEEFEVPGPTYGELVVNDPVQLELHQGALRIPWIGTIRKATTYSFR